MIKWIYKVSRRPKALSFLLVAMLAGCDVWGPADNPVDPDAPSYQGFHTVTNSSDIGAGSPTDGGFLDGSLVTIDGVAGATAYELRIAASEGELDSSPLFVKSDYTSNTMDLDGAPLDVSTKYYWKARAYKQGAWDVDWSPVASFTTGFTFTWTQRTSVGYHTWTSIASSSDGSRLAATTSNGDVYVSSDSGATWIDHNVSGYKVLTSIASSDDGARLAVVARSYYGQRPYIYTSTDYGTSWIPQSEAGARDWVAIASNSDGTHLAAIGRDTDSGETHI